MFELFEFEGWWEGGGGRWLIDIRISASDDNVFSAGRGCPWYPDMGRVRLTFSITCEIRLDDFVSLTLVLFQLGCF